MTKLPSPSLQIILTFLFINFISLPFRVKSQTLQEQEQQTLLKIKQNWGNPLALSSWNPSNASHCTWVGVNCTDGSVTGILLPNQNITGEIPAGICELRNLTTIDLSYNYIPGDFPTLLYNCTNLDYLDLSMNYFVGKIPEDIYRLSRLQFLNLGANNFSGEIPAGIGRFQALERLYLYQNQFNESLQAAIGNISTLVELLLAFNSFPPASIPPDFGRLKKLAYLWMTQTNLRGEIPDVLSNLEALEHLDLAMNDLSGKIPSGLFLLRKLKYLYLHKNRLSGEIPKSIEALDLTEIDLSMNQLTGTLPEGLGKLRNLTHLYLYINLLSGKIPASISLLPALIDIRLFNNSLTGVLPPELGLHSKLWNLEVSHNQLSGELPQYLCTAGVLDGFVVFSNNLTGTLPKWLGNCSSLTSVQLHYNRFSGEIPAGLWTSVNLTSLMITNNSFSGELPAKLALSLSLLYIENNMFTGEIPSDISASNNLTFFAASNNQFYGEIPLGLTALSQLTTLSLDGNLLSGDLPSNIISWRSLNILNLRKNKLAGKIPQAIGFLPVLNSLDLSGNQFSGEIPPQLGNLKLSDLNLSSNRLTGRVPTGLDSAAYDRSFLYNAGLCSDTPSLNLPSCISTTRDSHKSPSRLLLMILILAGLVSLLAVVFMAIIVYRRRKRGRDLAKWKLTSFQTLDFTESNIVKSLTERNLIGTGGSGKIYRVAVGNRAGEVVAVKKIWNVKKLDENLEKEFRSEVEILGRIRHVNIVKLLCCISSEDSKLLVYEYMENGSLDRWLHDNNSGRSRLGQLDWPTRLGIAVGAAQGLSYMHHSCSPPIIHRDVKSSNILLDTEFKVKIADFGLARMLGRVGDPQTMSAVAGSFGYIAPEYAYSTKVSEKSDVYSFGVVLLELVTGKEANNGDGETCLAEWAWRHFQEGNSMVDAIDQDIRESCDLDEMSVVLKLGLICTSTLPSSRPTMKDVLQILLRCGTSQGNGDKKGTDEEDVAPLLRAAGSFLYGINGSRRKRTSMDNDDDDGLACIV